MDVRLKEISNVSKCAAYLLKESTTKKSLRALKTLGSVHCKSTVRLCLYHPQLNKVTEATTRDAFPVDIQVCYREAINKETPKAALPWLSQQQVQRVQTLRRAKLMLEETRGSRGERYMSAAKVHGLFKWSIQDPQAFNIPRKQFEELRIDLNTSATEPEPETTHKPFQAMRELYHWFLQRTVGTPNQKMERAAVLVLHLSTYTNQRVKKAPQIYIHAQVNTGKSTLMALLKATFRGRVFATSPEGTRAFQTAGFTKKAKDAIWGEDEFTKYHYDAFFPPHFNKIAGDLDTYVAVKNSSQEAASYSGFTILLSNFTPDQVCANAESIHREEFDARFNTYTLKTPAYTEKQPEYQITDPVALFRDLKTVASQIDSVSTITLQLPTQRITTDGVYTPPNADWQVYIYSYATCLLI